MLAAGALVASLLAVSASPVGAATDSADHEADTNACVGDALADQGFTDVSDGHAFEDAINCIAYYDVTNGTGDGSTYSPNQEVTRAEMAVFIARAAKAAGVELKSGSGGFSDIDDVWEEAQDAINGLAASGMISKGGAYRPDDAVTRAEMASFLIGLLAKAAPNVTIDSNGAIQLGTGGSTSVADDYFADARAALPRANDAQVSAIYELGITKGASAAAVQDDTKPPLDFNYEPHGTVNRGQMAAFITRALAHTSARPEGVSAQYADGSVIVSVRDENFRPMSNVVVDVFRTDTNGVDQAFRANGSCGEVDAVGGDYECEIEDGADPITGGDGDAREALTGGVDRGGTTVWAWTGEDEDTVDGDTDLFRLNIPETADKSTATKASVTTEFGGSQQKLGSAVLYTLQLQDAKGDVTVGLDGKKPARYLATLSTRAFVGVGGTGDADSDGFADTPSIVTPVPLTTDSDGKAPITMSAPANDPAPTAKSDKYQVTMTIIPFPPDGGNAPTSLVDGDGADVPATGIAMVFSTERGVRTNPTDNTGIAGDISVSVKPAAEYLAASARGASNRVTVTVTNQYGDPIAGVRVTVTSDGTDDDVNNPVIGGGRAFAVGRDGSYTFSYKRSGTAGSLSATETLTATYAGYDHDGDGCSLADTTTAEHRCADGDDADSLPDGTPPVTGSSTGTVEWAAAASAAVGTVGVAGGAGSQIRAFDTETNTIFVGDPGSTVVVYYDMNDRFNIDRPAVGAGADPPPAADTYAGFERALSKADGYTLEWGIIESGSRATNEFELNIPAAS